MKKISPMLATLVEEPFDREGWIFETKWDGYRALATKDHLISRGNKSYDKKFPSLLAELKKLRGDFLIDGEIVIFDKSGLSNFQLLQNRKGTPYYYVFDLLTLNGKDLTKLPLIERKKRLKALVQGCKHIKYSKHVKKKGKKSFKAAEKKGLEGIIAKRGDSPYQSRRSRDWLKIKTKRRTTVIIGGFTEPKGSRKKFGALLIGVKKRGKLIYAGHVGGGFNHQTLVDVHAKLKKLITSKCPFSTQAFPNTPVTWVKPRLKCEVVFTEWTNDGKLRHPIFKGLV